MAKLACPPKVMYRNAASTTGEILKEREANAFAASLLMPRELIKEESLIVLKILMMQLNILQNFLKLANK